MKNKELWERLQQAAQKHQVKWIFVKSAADDHLQWVFELANQSIG